MPDTTGVKYEAFSGTADTQLTLTVVKGLVYWEDAVTPGTAEVNFRDGGATGTIVWHDELAASEERAPVLFGEGIKMQSVDGRLFVDMVSGNVRGIAWGF